MEAINVCPHHGFDTWMLVIYFYEGISPTMKQLLETMCRGDFMSKSPNEAFKFLNYGMSHMKGIYTSPSLKTIQKEECICGMKMLIYKLKW